MICIEPGGNAVRDAAAMDAEAIFAVAKTLAGGVQGVGYEGKGNAVDETGRMMNGA